MNLRTFLHRRTPGIILHRFIVGVLVLNLGDLNPRSVKGGWIPDPVVLHVPSRPWAPERPAANALHSGAARPETTIESAGTFNPAPGSAVDRIQQEPIQIPSRSGGFHPAAVGPLAKATGTLRNAVQLPAGVAPEPRSRGATSPGAFRPTGRIAADRDGAPFLGRPATSSTDLGARIGNLLAPARGWADEVRPLDNSWETFEVAQAFPLATAEPAPEPCTGLLARPKPGKVQLEWNPVPGAVTYEVYRGADADPVFFVKVGEAAGNLATFLDSTVANEATHLYFVRAIGPGGACDSEVAAAHPTTSRGLRNWPPVIYSRPPTTGIEGSILQYHLRAADPFPSQLITFSLLSGPSGMAMDPVTGWLTWEAREGTYDVEVASVDASGAVDTQSFSIVIPHRNQAPLADAGADALVSVQQTVTLDGSGSSDADGDPLTFFWLLLAKPDGSAATLSNPTAVTPSFLADKPGTYTIQLVVNDGTTDSTPDTVTILAENSPPVANAGPDQTVLVQQTVTLDGSGSSDIDGNPLSYSWSLLARPDGSGATLSDPTAVNPSFLADRPGTYIAQLVVNDGTADSAPDTVAISTENSPPVADAGPDQTVHVGQSVTLDGSSSSDVDGNALAYAWSILTKPEDSAATLSDPTAVQPRFLVDRPGTYAAQLVVNDGIADSLPDTVVISTVNSSPVADAGPDRTVITGEPVQLDGSGSHDADADPLSYSWSMIAFPGATGPGFFDDPSSATPRFTPGLPGLYVAQLIVNDGYADSQPDTVKIEADVALVPVPDVVEMPQSQAESAIVQASLTVGTLTSITHPTVPRDHVISQNPAAGTLVPAGTPVHLVLSLGPDLAVVPDVLRLPRSDAEAKIIAASVAVGDVTASFDPVVQAGRVRRQEPLGGTRVPAGTPVDIDLSLGPPNNPPDFTTMPALEAFVGRPYTYDFEAEDPDGDPLTYTLPITPPALRLDPDATLLRWTPVASDRGSHAVTLRASDGRGGIAHQPYTLVVTEPPPNRPPYFVSTPVTEVTAFLSALSDAVHPNLNTWSVVQFTRQGHVPPNPPQWSVSPDGLVAYQSNNTESTALVSQDAFGYGRMTGLLRTDNPLDDDWIGFVFAYQNSREFYLFDWMRKSVAVGDINIDQMRVRAYHASDPILDESINLSTNSHQVSLLFTNSIGWRPGVSYEFNLDYSPCGYLISIISNSTILATIPVPDSRYGAGRFGFYNYSQAQSQYSAQFHRLDDTASQMPCRYTYASLAADPDADPVTYALEIGPASMFVDPHSGLVRWSPDPTEIGPHAVTLLASDGRGGVARQSYTLTVVPDPANHPPIIISSPVTNAVAGIAYTYDVEAIDPDEDPLTYSLLSGPPDMDIAQDTGVITWSPCQAPLEFITTNSSARSITTDALGNVLIAGNFVGSVNLDPCGSPRGLLTATGEYGLLVAKFTPSGHLIWARATQGPGDCAAHGVAVDPAGNVYLTGLYRGTVDFDPGPETWFGPPSAFSPTSGNGVFVLKLDRQGGFVWAAAVPNPTGEQSGSGYDLKVDRSGNVYATGSFAGNADFDPGPGVHQLTSTSADVAYIWKLAPNGTLVWARQVDHHGSLSSRGWSLDLDSAGNPCVTGYFRGSQDFDPGPAVTTLSADSNGTFFDVFVWKLSSSGDYLWAHAFHAPESQDFNDGLASQLLVAPDDSVYVTGTFAGKLYYDSAQSTPILTASAPVDIFLAQIDPGGALRWTRRTGGLISPHQGGPYYLDLARSTDGHIHLLSHLIGTQDVDPGPEVLQFTTTDAAEMLVSQFAPDGTFVSARVLRRPLTELLGGLAFGPGGQEYVAATVSTPAGAMTGLFVSGFSGPTVPVSVRVDDGRGGFDTQQYSIQLDNTPTPSVVDLAVAGVDRSQLKVDSQSLAAVGTVKARVANLGSDALDAPVEVLAFEDVNYNGKFDVGVDTELGRSTLGAPVAAGGDLSTQISVQGLLSFPGAIVWVFVDSSNVVPETDEANNVDRNEVTCQLVSGHDAPDLTASNLRARPSGAALTVTARIGNQGEVLVGPGLNVAFYEGDPSTGGRLLGVTQLSGGLELGSFLDAALEVGSISPVNVHVVADDDGTGRGQVSECDEANNLHAPFAGAATASIAGTVFNDLNRDVVFQDQDWIYWTTGTGTGLMRARLDGSCRHEISGSGIGGVAFDVVGGYLYATDGTSGDRYLFRSRFDGSGKERLTDAWPAEVELDLVNGKVYWSHTWDQTPGELRGIWRADLDGKNPEHLLRTDSAATGIAVDTASNRIFYVLWSGQVRVFDTERRVDEAFVVPAFGPYDIEIDLEGGWVYWNEHLKYVNRPERFMRARLDGTGSPEVVFVVPRYLANAFHFNPATRQFYYPDWEPDSLAISRFNADGTGFEPLFQVQTGIFSVELLHQGPEAGQEGVLEGFQVFIDANGNGVWDTGEPATESDACGRYSFANLRAGGYWVRLAPRPGWEATRPDGAVVVVLHEGEIVLDANLGAAALPVAVPNRPPAFVTSPPASATPVQMFRYDARAVDPDGDTVSYILASGPAGMIIHEQGGAVIWQAKASDLGQHVVTLRAVDPLGASAIQTFTLEVVAPNESPIITSRPTGPAVVGRLWQYEVRAQDPDGDAVSFHLEEGPSGAALGEFGLLAWTPAASDVGVHHVAVAATDARGAGSVQSFELPVIANAENRPPQVLSQPRTIAPVGQTWVYELVASDPDGDPLSLEAVTLPEGMIFGPADPPSASARLVRWTPTGTQVGPHDIALRVSDGRVTLSQSFTVEVRSQVQNRSPSIVSTPPSGAVFGALYAYNAIARDPDNDTVRWSLGTAPTGMSIDPALGTIRWNPGLDALGPHSVSVQAVDGLGGFATQAYILTVRAANLPPLITSAPPTRASTNDLYTYAVESSDPEGEALTYALTSAPTGMQIDAGNGWIEWSPTPDQLGTNQVVVEVADPHGALVRQEFEVVVSDIANGFPVITSTPALAALVNIPYAYPVTATDPDRDPLSFQLLESPPGMVINAQSGELTWTPTAADVGARRVTVVAIDPPGAGGTQTFDLVVFEANSPPSITSRPNQVVNAGQLFQYDIAAADPDGDPLSYSLTGPNGMTIDGIGRVRWQTRIDSPELNRVEITVSDPLGQSQTQSFDLAVFRDTTPPRVFLAGADRLPVGTILDVSATATDNVGVTSLTFSIAGQVIPLDSRGRASVRLDASGIFEVLARATDAAGNVGQDGYTLTVLAVSPDPNAPEVALTAPNEDAIISAGVNILGTAADENLLLYKLSVALAGTLDFQEIARGTSSVRDGVLGRFDPTGLPNDTYVLRLEAQDPQFTSTVDVTVHVAGDLKIGNFTLSFVDLSIPVNGLPITVGRTYDSLNAASSADFGHGWRLEFRDTNLRNNLPPRSEFEIEYGFFPAFTDRTRVFITVPGGKRQGFSFRPQRMSGWAGSMFGFHKPAFQPDTGVTSALTVEAGPNVVLRRDDSTGGWQAVDGNGGTTPYNPEDPVFGGGYTLTTKEGLAFRIDAATRQLTQVIDPNGSTVDFTDTAIISSAGPRVTLTRDGQGRITSVTDPSGKTIRYQYDAQGDLVSVSDREDQATRFVYSQTRPHYLEQVIDPLGRTGVRTEYDDQGRLVKLVDAAGNPVHLIHDTASFTEQVVDALGRATTFVYDDRGNVLQEVNALGAITTRAYDLQNNLTEETDPLGHTTRFTYDSDGNLLTRTDPLGQKTVNTYLRIPPRGWFNFTGRTMVLLESTIDPLGRLTRNTYDSAGNLVSTTDPQGRIARYTYDGFGNQTSVTDALGQATAFAYDGAGRLLQQTDALGHVTSFTYDANGNQVSQSTTVTGSGGLVAVTTTTEYDANGRPIAVTDALGNTTRTEYDARGKTAATINALGHRTRFEYDDRGQMVRTIFPDGASTRLEYDAVGRPIASIDRAGRTTRFIYDAVGRLTQTLYPDATPDDTTDDPRTFTAYDAAGRVLERQDELGNRTQFGYDAAGRQTSVTNALRYVTRSEYDAAGRRIAQVDALGRRTEFRYEEDCCQRTTTVFADGTTRRTEHDLLGRTVREIDQVGVITAFGYDALGRLTRVTNAVGTPDQIVTTYEYNEAGNLVVQRDALGRVTRYEYDALGRRTATILPMGERSSTVYNALGNVETATDFNGNTIRYEYDVNNRLARKLFRDGTSVVYTYTPSGRRETITDARGLTRWEYDSRDRLLRRTDPDGRAIAYTYDKAGNRLDIIAPSGVRRHTFDALNRLKSVADPEGGITEYTYDAANNIVRQTNPNATVRINRYDALNRVTYIEHAGPQGVFASFDYTIGANGNRASVREFSDFQGVKSTVTRTWSYDHLNRLTREEFSGPDIPTRTMTYVMDAVGNRLARIDTGEGLTTYTYNDNDELLTETLNGVVTAYTYDANGNTLSKSNASESTTYQWSDENRLVGAAVTSGGTTKILGYQYDDAGIRVASSVAENGNTSDTTYLVDANRPYAQVQEEWVSYNAQPPHHGTTYTYGHHQPLIQNRSGDRTYYHADHLGSTRALSSHTGNAAGEYAFDAYGRILMRTSPSQNNYRFGGEWLDPALNLYYLRARYFSANSGRLWIRDTWEGVQQRPPTRHAYIFGLNNPLLYADPSGKVPFSGVPELMISLAVQNQLRAINFVKGGIAACKATSNVKTFNTALTLSQIAFGLTYAAIEADPKVGFQFDWHAGVGFSPIKQFGLRVDYDTASGKPSAQLTLDLLDKGKLRYDYPDAIKFGRNIELLKIKGCGVVDLLSLDITLREEMEISPPSIAFSVALEASIGPTSGGVGWNAAKMKYQVPLFGYELFPTPHVKHVIGVQ